jgi:single-strand DNA-binding protein
MYLNRVTLIGFIGRDAERNVVNATNIAIFSLATKTSWKNDAGSWESRTEWHRCVAFGKLADFACTLSKGAHVAIEGELRRHEYQREVAVGTRKTTLPQRVWEIRVDSVLKLDRAAKLETVESQQEMPRSGASPLIPLTIRAWCRIVSILGSTILHATFSQLYRWCSPPRRGLEATHAFAADFCSTARRFGVSLSRES